MSPFGHTTHLRIVVDPDLLQYGDVCECVGCASFPGFRARQPPTASQPAPECPGQPMMRPLIDLTAVTSVLYPG